MPTRSTKLREPCCHDGVLTDQPVKVGEAHTPAGVGTDIYSCPRHLPLYQPNEWTEQAS
jgi:hypothetical protein